MKPPPILSTYLGRHFISGIAMMMGIMLGLIFLIDLAELFRRSWGRENISFWIIVQMAIFKIPFMAQKVLPFAALFGGMLAFVRLTRTNQLVVARAAGLSVWQFLFPAIAIALVAGLFVVTLFNPLASTTTSLYESLESKHLRGRSSLLAVSRSGLWLRQADESSKSVIHARGVSQHGTELSDVIVFLYDEADRFTGRIDANLATLELGYWRLIDAIITGPDRPVQNAEEFQLTTTLTLAQIQDSFASPETLSFWSLPRFIETLERAGFSALRHRLHWQSILAGPLLLCAMVLIAATFSIRLTRRGGAGLLAAGGVFAGFLLYFLSDVVYAMGLSGAVPVALAAWAPAGICALLGLTTLLHLEDG
jgi:lipopolysaccharide export system permease protein